MDHHITLPTGSATRTGVLHLTNGINFLRKWGEMYYNKYFYLVSKKAGIWHYTTNESWTNNSRERFLGCIHSNQTLHC